ncbi:MAG: polysaccharide biosynthesis/export family protein [Verrucomicrobiota bacterium]
MRTLHSLFLLVLTVPLLQADDSSTDSAYRLRNYDKIRMTVYQEDDLHTEARIMKSGKVSFPLLGEVKIEGLTLSEAIQKITELYDKDYLVKPSITLSITEYSIKSVTVLGEVQKPGAIEFPADEKLDLPSAIALAGGFTKIANTRKVVVKRTKADDKIETRLFDAKEMAESSAPFFLKPGDTVTVQQRIF